MFTPTTRSPTYSPLKELASSKFSTLDSTMMESPYHSRIKSIGKRFNNLQTTIEVNSAVNKQEQVETRIRQIDAKITDNHNLTEDKLKKYNDDLRSLEEGMAAEIIARELLEERKIKEMTLVESNLALDLKDERKQAVEGERKILTKVEEKIHAVRENFIHEQRRLNELRDHQTHTIGEQIVKLQEKVQQEQNLREQIQNTIVNSIGSKISEINETITTERKVRQETESFLFTKIEDISTNLHAQVIAERDRRERTESQMIALLEEACNQFEYKLGRKFRR